MHEATPVTVAELAGQRTWRLIQGVAQSELGHLAGRCRRPSAYTRFYDWPASASGCPVDRAAAGVRAGRHCRSMPAAPGGTIRATLAIAADGSRHRHAGTSRGRATARSRRMSRASFITASDPRRVLPRRGSLPGTRRADRGRLCDADMDGLLLLRPGQPDVGERLLSHPQRAAHRPLPASPGAPVLLCALLEKENAEQSWIADIRCYLEYPGETPAEVWMAAQLPGARIGIDAASYATFAAMAAVKPGLALDDTVSRLRFIKTDAEIELTRIAARYADFGLEIARHAVADGLRGGISELDVVQIVQSETTGRMKRELADLVNFYRGAVALTAHTGPRGALPHGQPGPVAIRPATR